MLFAEPLCDIAKSPLTNTNVKLLDFGLSRQLAVLPPNHPEKFAEKIAEKSPKKSPWSPFTSRRMRSSARLPAEESPAEHKIAEKIAEKIDSDTASSQSRDLAVGARNLATGRSPSVHGRSTFGGLTGRSLTPPLPHPTPVPVYER